MATRIHVVLDEAEKALFRRQAAREGKSLGAWIREAAAMKLAASADVTRLDSAARLNSFFAECDAREAGREPDWDEHRRVIDGSRAAGIEVT